MSKFPLIVFEGIDGSGKTHHINKIKSYLKKKKIKFIILREPGGSKNSEIIRKIISVDLEAVVKHADYLIVKWDTSVFRGGGTHGEVTMAYWLGKPVYLVNSLPIADISSWIFSCSEEIFDAFESLKKRLEKIYC